MRLENFSPVLLCFAFVTLSSTSQSQVRPAAVGSERHLWGGVEFSNFQNDWIKYKRSDGIGFYGDYLITNRLGIEGEIRLLNLNSVSGTAVIANGKVQSGTINEKTYLAGPIFNAYQYHHLEAYGKVLLGVATASYPPSVTYSNASGSYFAFEPGGGVEYRLSRNFKVRGEYDYQIWPSAPGDAISFPKKSSGLTPNGFSVGVSYQIF